MPPVQQGLEDEQYVKSALEASRLSQIRLQKLAESGLDDVPGAIRRLGKLGRKCMHCAGSPHHQDEKMLQCSRCEKTWYCSRECQTAAWKRHKKECTRTNKVNDLVEEIAMEFPDRSSAYNQLGAIKSLVDIELHTAMMHAMRLGWPDDCHLTHSGYFVFEFHEEEPSLRNRFKLVKAGIEPKEEGIQRILGGQMAHMRDEQSVRRMFEYEELARKTRSNPPLPKEHPFAVTLQAIGEHKHPGQALHTGTIAAISGAFGCSLYERITVLAKPARCDDWLRILDLSLSLPQPLYGHASVDVMFGLCACGSSEEYLKYYKDFRAYQVRTGDFDSFWNPTERATMLRKIQGLVPSLEKAVLGGNAEMKATDERMRPTIANAKKKARKQRAAARAAAGENSSEPPPEPNPEHVLLRHRARRLDCMNRV